MMKLETLKTQQRWVLWKYEENGGKQTKVPYQPNGYHAKTNDPSTWHTHEVCLAYAGDYSGLGLMLGEVEGVSVFGVDIDACAEPDSGKLSKESLGIIQALNTYTEASPSKTGCHILGLGKLPGRGIKKPHPGTKAVEVKSDGYYFTFTETHLAGTPDELMDRQAEVTALYESLEEQSSATAAISMLPKKLTTFDEERFAKLIAGNISDYDDDHSVADYAFCLLLAKMYGCNAFKIDEEFRASGLNRQKWDRKDYRERTITRAILTVAQQEPLDMPDSDSDKTDDSGESEFLIESLPESGHDCWFPLGELSVIGAPSGAGKTSWAIPMLEDIRNCREVWGHPVSKARDYRVLLHDRSKKAMRRTARAMHLSEEAMRRVIRLNTEQQKSSPDKILQSAIEQNPGVGVWLIEGLDLWIPDMHKMSCVGPVIDGIQRIAYKHNVAVLATVGSPKQRGKDRYNGRDSLFGSSALGRKVETVVLMNWHDEKDPNSVRVCWVMPRNGKAEKFYFTWEDGQLVQTDEPEGLHSDDTYSRMTRAVRELYSPGDEVKYTTALKSESTFYRWRKWAIKKGVLNMIHGKACLASAQLQLVAAAA